ncbi:MAG: DUF4194 domain-containing protein [Deltaproteobacteria bacterium]|jgi:hypothetical protein|nr:DUF4194 domain-containing protein [Deltaproteobacteria bacterium]
MSFHDQDPPFQGPETAPGGPLEAEAEDRESVEEVESLEGQPGDIHDLPRGLFSGDRGRLPFQARLVLCRLLKGPYIDRAQTPELWSGLVRYQDAVEAWLGEIFVELVADLQAGVGFIRQVDAAQLPVSVPTLLRRRKVGFLESLLLIYLRERLSLAELQGERATVRTSEMTEHLRVFRRKGDTDLSGLDKRINAAIFNVANKYYFLRRVGSAAEDVYEISPTLKLILPPETIEMLREEYQDYLGRIQASASPDGDGLEDLFGLEAEGPDGDGSGQDDGGSWPDGPLDGEDGDGPDGDG